MIRYVIPLLESWMPIWNEYMVDVFCLGFIAFVGCFIHYVIRR